MFLLQIKIHAMNKNKALWTLVGFLLVVLGFLSLGLTMVGVKLRILLWMDWFGPLPSFMLKIVLVLGGFVLVYLAQTDFTQLNEDEITE